jgi:dephospho-CoA kinase
MGKSTTAELFRKSGISVFDADAAVHQLYQNEAASLIEETFPGTTAGGQVDRGLLAKAVLGNSAALQQLEKIVHPLVRAKRDQFLCDAALNNQMLVVLDIPLLFETGDTKVDYVVLATAPEAVQRDRLMARPGMTEERFKAILARQMPDAEKRQRADFIIDTSHGLDAAQTAVEAILKKLLG